MNFPRPLIHPTQTQDEDFPCKKGVHNWDHELHTIINCMIKLRHITFIRKWKTLEFMPEDRQMGLKTFDLCSRNLYRSWVGTERELSIWNRKKLRSTANHILAVYEQIKLHIQIKNRLQNAKSNRTCKYRVLDEIRNCKIDLHFHDASIMPMNAKPRNVNRTDGTPESNWEI